MPFRTRPDQCDSQSVKRRAQRLYLLHDRSGSTNKVKAANTADMASSEVAPFRKDHFRHNAPTGSISSGAVAIEHSVHRFLATKHRVARSSRAWGAS